VKTDGSLSNGWKPESKRRVAAVAGLLAALALAACGGAPRMYYYTLRMPAPPARSDPKTAFALGVEHFRAPEMLRDDRILYYQSPTEMNFYEYHRWGSDPASMFSDLALGWIQGTGVFTEARMLPAREPVDYILRGRLEHFEEVDEAGGSKGRVGVELTLLRSSDHKVVWSDRRQAESAVEEKGVAGVVQALNESSQQLLREALPGMIEQVEREYKSSQGPTP